MDMQSSLSRKFTALSDPTRRAILARLAQGDATVTELGKPFLISQPAISKHLKVLEGAGLIERGHDAQSRGRGASTSRLSAKQPLGSTMSGDFGGTVSIASKAFWTHRIPPTEKT